jgi:hypothetical protein
VLGRVTEEIERSDLATQIRLFAVSYAPLFALLALRFEKNPLWAGRGMR